jgi:hypothetical protein
LNQGFIMLRNCNLPPGFEIYARVFNTPEKKRRLAHEVLGNTTTHVDKILRGAVRSDLERVCATIHLATTFPDEAWERPGTNIQRAGLLADYPREFYLFTTEPDTHAYHCQEERTVDAVAILSEAKDVVEALAFGKSSRETLKELVELRDKADEAIARLCAPEEARS